MGQTGSPVRAIGPVRKGVDDATDPGGYADPSGDRSARQLVVDHPLRSRASKGRGEANPRVP
jgi:hypothetical protein